LVNKVICHKGAANNWNYDSLMLEFKVDLLLEQWIEGADAVLVLRSPGEGEFGYAVVPTNKAD
jgi:hypothetical protein